MIKKILSGVIGACIFAAAIPTAIGAVNGANTTGWDVAQAALFGVSGIIILGGSIYSIAEDYGIV